MPQVNIYVFHLNDKKGEPTQAKGAFEPNLPIFWQKLLRSPCIKVSCAPTTWTL